MQKIRIDPIKNLRSNETKLRYRLAWCNSRKMKRAEAGLKIVDINDIRNINQTVLLHLIRERQPISRVQIANITGLRPGTISAIVNRLMLKGVIYEGAEGPSSGGRKPTYLYINSENAYVLAIDLGVRETVYAVSDFNGRILKQKALVTEGNPITFLDKLAAEIETTITKHYPRVKFAGVGVSSPGLIIREPAKSPFPLILGGTTSRSKRSSRKNSSCLFLSKTTRTPRPFPSCGTGRSMRSR